MTGISKDQGPSGDSKSVATPHGHASVDHATRRSRTMLLLAAVMLVGVLVTMLVLRTRNVRQSAPVRTRAMLNALTPMIYLNSVEGPHKETDQVVALIGLNDGEVAWMLTGKAYLSEGRIHDEWGNPIWGRVRDEDIFLRSFGANGQDDEGIGDDIVASVLRSDFP